MEKVNFNDAGLQQLLQEIYLLNNQQLQEEVLLVQTDMRQWMKDRFLLNTAQEADLDHVDNTFMNDASSQLAYFMLNRLPVSLYKAESPLVLRGEDRGKLYRNERKTTQIYHENLGNSNTETLSFTIEYLSSSIS